MKDNVYEAVLPDLASVPDIDAELGFCSFQTNCKSLHSGLIWVNSDIGILIFRISILGVKNKACHKSKTDFINDLFFCFLECKNNIILFSYHQ